MSALTAVHGGTAPLAALTSVFTPPCPTSWLLTTTRVPSQYPAFPTTGPPSCDPPSWRTNIARAGFHYYSPAVCPAGFVVGPNCGIAKVRTDEGFPAIEPGETAAYCVPIGLTCTTDLTDFRGGIWGFARAGSTAGALVTIGPAIQIRWVEADLTMLETHPLTPGLKLARTGPDTSAAIRQSSTSTDTSTTTGAPDKKLTAQSEQLSSTTLVTKTRFNEDSGVTQIFDTGSRTSILGPANTTAGNSNGSGGLGSLDRTTSIVVIVVVTVVAGILLWVAAFLLVRRYKKRGMRKGAPPRPKTPGGGSSWEHGSQHTRANSRVPKSIGSPMSELEPGPPAIGSTPNPAELEGEVLQPPARSWMHRASRVRHSSQHLQPPPYTPRSMASTGSGRRTVRESFGEKVNDPAAALSRLRIPNPLSMSMSMGHQSPSDASPRNISFWRVSRSPRSPAGGARMSRQLPCSGVSHSLMRVQVHRRGTPMCSQEIRDN
ncbi:hypothetical protein C8A05DRAFT_46333 [Staphylotrichum tortipilum]|uniref:Uncharacterized protein n=1 Tax=Staphylotrichum tortipilum TaxID=2831512 RepID=A0AAN6MGG1_9PEZI|nr:hypothetical protein C8A05DRAFT_46333 [Staphylotrichum longicolle]